MKNQPNEYQIINFLKKAHAAGWPHNVRGVSMAGLHKFEDTYFADGDWEFYDLYGGRVTDIGFQVIFYKKQQVWGASYRGGVLTDYIKPEKVFSFLVEALAAPNAQALPLRGPSYYGSSDKKWAYKYQLVGDFHSFLAVEQIQFEGESVYERSLIGGECGNKLYGKSIPLFTRLSPNQHSASQS